MIDYSRLPLHMQDGARRYIENGIEGGSFLNAVLQNQLVQAIGMADDMNRDAIWDWANWLHNEVPANCWGSPEKVAAWISKGGLRGNEAP